MTRPTSRRLSRLSALAVAAVALPLAAVASPAAADGYQEFSCTAAPNGVCIGAPNPLRAVQAWTDTNVRVGSGASPTGSIADLVGGRFVWGLGYSCTTYTGNQVLYPLVANGSPTASLALGGLSTFGPGAQGC